MSNFFFRSPGLTGPSFLQIAMLGSGLALSVGSAGTSKNKASSPVTIFDSQCSASRPSSLRQAIDRYSLSCRYNGGDPTFKFTMKQREGNTVCADGTHLHGVVISCAGARFDLKMIPAGRRAVTNLPTMAEEQAVMAKAMLEEHNKYRAALKLNPLTWLDSLAERAAKWAAHLVSLGGKRLVSSDIKATGQGENLWMGAAGKHDYAAIIKSWGKQKEQSVQMMGRRTTRVGCALARAGDNDMLVCRYWPPGR